MIAFLVVWIKQLLHLPHFLLLTSVDFARWLWEKGWTIFDNWGLHLYVGAFGAGKTSSLVHDAYCIAKAYPQVTILSNFALYNFPPSTQILPLRQVEDILTAPDNTLVLIDEIGTIFNSRDFLGKKGVPKILFQHICQCRKRHIQILATTQRWNFLDKQLRDITATVTVSRVSFKHPFSRMCTCRVYDALDYDLAFSNPVYRPDLIGSEVYIQTDALRNRYDTSELVQTIMASDYIPDDEILASRCDSVHNPVELSRQGKRAVRKNVAK